MVFLARVVAFFVDRIVFRTERGTGPGYFITVLVCQIVFGVLAAIIVAWFSRRREFRADAGSAQYLGSPQPMMRALARLGGLPPGELPKSLNGFGITDKSGHCVAVRDASADRSADTRAAVVLHRFEMMRHAP